MTMRLHSFKCDDSLWADLEDIASEMSRKAFPVKVTVSDLLRSEAEKLVARYRLEVKNGQ